MAPKSRVLSLGISPNQKSRIPEKAPSSTASTTPATRPPSRLANSVAWMTAGSWSTQLVTWIGTITVARVLSPSDFGLIGMANLLLGLATVVSDSGLPATIIAMPGLTKEELSQLNSVSVLIGVAVFAVACLTAFPLGAFFRAPNLPGVVMAMSLAFVITSFRTVPGALITREFGFKLVAQARAAEAFVYSAATLTLALLGAGYWSFVVGGVLGATVSTMIAFCARPHPFAWPELSALRNSLTFCRHVLVNRIASYAYSNADFLVAGRTLGQAALGSYTIAWNVANLPVQRISDQVTNVVPAYFSNVQNDEAALRRYVLRMTEALLLVILPLSLGASVLADQLIFVALGPKWMSSALPLRILVLYIAGCSITNLFIPLLNVRGESRFVMWNNVAAALYFPAGFYFGSGWGAAGIALMWPLLYPLVLTPLCARALKQIKLRWQDYMVSVRPALSGSLVMTIYLLMLKTVLPDSIAIYLRLAIEIITGAATYYLVVATLHRDQLRRLYTLVRTAT
jgi:teichuronic acid exporter